MSWFWFSATFLMAGAGLLAAGNEPVRYWNTFRITAGEVTTDVEWISPSTYRFSRAWTPQPVPKAITTEAVLVVVTDLGAQWEFRSKYVTLQVAKTGTDLKTLAGDASLTAAVRRENGNVIIEESVARGERFYGLGARTDEALNLRGRALTTKRPFLLSSLGYGENYRGAGQYAFDLAASKPDRRQVIAPGSRAEFCFYYGPEPKPVFEEHLKLRGAVPQMAAEEFAIRRVDAAAGEAGWEGLRQAVYSLQHASLSAVLAPEFDLSPYQGAAGPVFEVAAGLGAFLPAVTAAAPSEANQAAYRAMETQRHSMIPYLLTYSYEAHWNGIPFVRPLAMQFPGDAAAAARSDLLMVGDELLLAPRMNAEAYRRVYFPRGVWTGWRTDRIYRGRQEARLDPEEGPVGIFIRNGSILPVAAPEGNGPMELHYFPTLGAEFFLYEEEEDNVSQFHAAPSAGFLRFEAESLVERTYEWIAHHTEECTQVEAGGQILKRVAQQAELAPGSWYYDKARKQLHIRVRPAAHSDLILNVSQD